jgi:DNA-binding MarR family transcriptional regulator
MYSEYEIFGTNQQMRKVIEQACERLMETYGLRHVELDILYLISHEKQKDTAKDLIEIQHLSKAHISKSVDNLKQHGYIELVADEADHRKIHIRMTGKAKPVLEEFEQIRIDLSAVGFLLQNRDRLFMRQGFLVRTVGRGERVVDVGYRHDA